MSTSSESSLHTYKACLGREDLDRIVQSCVFLSEHVLLPSSVTPSPHLDSSTQAMIRRRLNELNEIGAIQFWEIEGQSDFLKRSQPQLANSSFLPRHVIPIELYRDLYQKIVQRLVDNRLHFLGTAIPGSLDGIAEFVLGKHALWTIALNEYLRTNRIVFDPIAAHNAMRFFADLLSKSNTTEKVIEKILYRFNIPDLTLLSIRELERCRQLLPAVRQDVEKRVAESSPSTQFHEEQIAEQIANQIFEEFFDSIQERISELPEGKVFEWHIGRLELSASVKKEHAPRFFGWVEGRPSHPPLLQLLEVRRMIQRHESVEAKTQ